MKSFLTQCACAAFLVLVVLHSAEAPRGFVFEEKENAEDGEITLAFAGDIMLGRNVEVLMEMNGHAYPFASTSEIFDRADSVIANLEGPVPRNHVHTKSGEMSFSFPQYVPRLLHDYGIDSVSLANNHTYDKGASVYHETAQALYAAGISSFGHPIIQSSQYAQNFTINNVPFTLVGFNATYPSFDLDEASHAIEETKAMFPEGVLIAFMHWGTEYELVSNEEQQTIANALHDAGANLVIGAHPHVTQEIRCESMQRCTIFSLGNFIFDQYFSKDVEQGLVAYVTIGKDGIKQIEIQTIDGSHSQPKIMQENKVFLADLLRRSQLTGILLSTSTGSLVLKAE